MLFVSSRFSSVTSATTSFKACRVRPQFLHLGRRRLSGGVSRQPVLAGFQKLPVGGLLRIRLSGSAFDQA